MQAYIAIRGAENTSELSDVPPDAGLFEDDSPVLNHRATDALGRPALANAKHGAGGEYERKRSRIFISMYARSITAAWPRR